MASRSTSCPVKHWAWSVNPGAANHAGPQCPRLGAPRQGSTILLDGRVRRRRAGRAQPGQVKSIQIVFQNPDSALNRSQPVRRMIGRTISRLVGTTGAEVEQRVRGLASSRAASRPLSRCQAAAISGGLKQRVAIARAFAGDPRIVVCDEPTSALDVSVQAAILNLLVALQTSKQVSYIFISHDLGVVRYLSDRIAVLYLGQLMELGPAGEVFGPPPPLYRSTALLGAGHRRTAKETREAARRDPSAVKPPGGCVFHTRCTRKIGAICENVMPDAVAVNGRHMVRCHIPPGLLPREGQLSAEDANRS